MLSEQSINTNWPRAHLMRAAHIHSIYIFYELIPSICAISFCTTFPKWNKASNSTGWKSFCFIFYDSTPIQQKRFSNITINANTYRKEKFDGGTLCVPPFCRPTVPSVIIYLYWEISRIIFIDFISRMTKAHSLTNWNVYCRFIVNVYRWPPPVLW